MKRGSGRTALRIASTVALAWLALALPSAARAQTGGGRVLRALEIDARGEETEVRILFSVPVRYLRHTPEHTGRTVDIRLTPLSGELAALLTSESLRPRPGTDTALEEVWFEGEGRAGARLELRLGIERRFDVRQDEDLRTLVIRLFGERSAPTTPAGSAPKRAPPARSAAPAPPAPDSAELEALVREGRRALAAGDSDRAVRIFTVLTGYSEHAYSAEAKELLGVARERNGQRAHARAEYEEFLERYPDGEAAVRVRQRLDALLTATAKPAEPLRTESSTSSARTPWDVYGSVSANYRRDVAETDELGRFIFDHSIFSDLFVGVRGTAGRFDLSGEFAGFHLTNLGPDSNEWRIDTVRLEIEDREGPISGIVGRQSGNSAGVLRRFDGLTLRYELGDRWAVNARAGFPVDPFLNHWIEDERILYGASLEGRGLLPGFEFEAFAIQQRFQGRNERTAIGAELQYVRDPFFLAGYVDYDVQFGELNTAYLVANWRATAVTNVNLLLDYRNVPTLTRSNALLGQPVDRLGELEGRFPDEDVDSIAEDRTLRAKLTTLGITHQLTERFQLAGDFTVTDLSGTPTSAGVLEFEGTGHQYTYLLQLIGSSLIRSGDVMRIAVGYQDFGGADRTALRLSTRVPLGRRLRVTPRLDLEWRNPEIGEHHRLVRPGLRVDWRIGAITIDAEAGYEWLHGERVVGAGDERGYTVVFGVRYDF
ncbi:MAG: hypothetical protein OEP95_01525 [Myxococcales bacterium]|nr:hypothetical protein [Myxococcales bacterium]